MILINRTLCQFIMVIFEHDIQTPTQSKKFIGIYYLYFLIVCIIITKPTALYFEAGNCSNTLANSETGTSVFVKLLFLIICRQLKPVFFAQLDTQMSIFQCQNLQVSQGRDLLLGKMSLGINVKVCLSYGGLTQPLCTTLKQTM